MKGFKNIVSKWIVFVYNGIFLKSLLGVSEYIDIPKVKIPTYVYSDRLLDFF